MADLWSDYLKFCDLLRLLSYVWPIKNTFKYVISESEQLISRTCLCLYKSKSEIQMLMWHFCTICLASSHMEGNYVQQAYLHVYTLRELLLACREKWYRECWVVDKLECQFCLGAGANYNFSPAHTGIEPGPPAWVESVLTSRPCYPPYCVWSAKLPPNLVWSVSLTYVIC